MTFVAWLLQQRKRPEAMIRWQDADQNWLEFDQPPVVLELGRPTVLAAIFDNVGRASGDQQTMVNLGVPDFVRLWRGKADADDKSSLVSTNTICGILERGDRCNFLVGERVFSPHMTWMFQFTVTVTENPGIRGPFNIFAVMSNDRFTARGRQYFPSHFGHKPPEWRRGMDWPGDRMSLVDTREVRTGEVCAREVGVSEIRPIEVSIGEVGPRKVCVGKGCSAEVGAGKVGACELATHEIGAGQVSSREVDSIQLCLNEVGLGSNQVTANKRPARRHACRDTCKTGRTQLSGDWRLGDWRQSDLPL